MRRLDSDVEVQLDAFSLHSWNYAAGEEAPNFPEGCGGFILYRNTPGALRFVTDLEQYLDVHRDKEDQEGLNALIKERRFGALVVNLQEHGRRMDPDLARNPRYRVRYLPQLLFPNGHIFQSMFNDGKIRKKTIDPVIFHMNGFHEKKETAIREHAWALDQDGKCVKERARWNPDS